MSKIQKFKKNTKNTGKQLFVASVAITALFGLFTDRGAFNTIETETAQAGGLTPAQTEYAVNAKTDTDLKSIGQAIDTGTKDIQLYADDPTELPPKEVQAQEWATRIDQFIAETNPNLSNTACGPANGQIWVDAGLKYGNHPYFLVAIAVADTSLGNGLTNKCNLGNTGHCDSCASGHQYNSFANSIYSISQTLSNEYLGKGTKSCHFSVGGWNYCPEGRNANPKPNSGEGYFYASSKVNWNRNVNTTLAKLFATEFRHDFDVKI